MQSFSLAREKKHPWPLRVARPSIISAMRWSASASYVFYADNKWNVAFEAGFRRSASREPFLRGDLVAREEEGTNTHTYTYTEKRKRKRQRILAWCHGCYKGLLSRARSYRVFRRVSKGRVPPRCSSASLWPLVLSFSLLCQPTQSTLTSKSAGSGYPSLGGRPNKNLRLRGCMRNVANLLALAGACVARFFDTPMRFFAAGSWNQVQPGAVKLTAT